jgi:predicted alpha/beta hydrolase family esterase
MKFKPVVILVAWCLLLVLFGTWFKQESLIYPGKFRNSKIPDKPFVHLANGSWYLERKNSKKIWIVLGGNNSMPHDFKKEALASEYSFLLVHYPGFGRKTGNTRPKTTFRLINECLKECFKRIKYKEINFVCHSIGCGIGLHYIAHAKKFILKKVGRVVLLAPFWKLEEVIANKKTYILPEKMITMLIDHTWNNYEHIKLVPRNIEVIIVHGSKDSLIDYKQGKRLSNVRKGTRFIMTNDDHDTITNKIHKIVTST